MGGRTACAAVQDKDRGGGQKEKGEEEVGR